MSSVEFDTETEAGNLGRFTSHTILGAPRLPGMAGWLMARGVIKSESGAHAFMIGLILFNFIVAGLIIYFFVLR